MLYYSGETYALDKGGPDSMWLQSSKKQQQTPSSFSFTLKCGAILLLFALCALIVACGSSDDTNQGNLGNPVVTVTIDLNQSNSSSTPPLPSYLCGAWVTNTSPADNPHHPVYIYAKFVQNNTPQDPGNPVGVDGALGTATVQWPDGTADTVKAKTTADGLAVFPVILKPSAANKIVLVQVTFTKDGLEPCIVPQPAYFTPAFVAPTPTPTPNDNGNGTGPFDIPTVTPLFPPYVVHH